MPSRTVFGSWVLAVILWAVDQGLPLVWPNPPVWAGWIAIGAAIILAIYGLVRWLSEQASERIFAFLIFNRFFRPNTDRLWGLFDEFDSEVSDAIKVMWDKLRDGYGKWKEDHTDGPATFDELVSSATYPDWLPTTDIQTNVAEIADQKIGQADWASKTIYNFAQDVYHPKSSGGYASHVFDDQEMENFDKNRKSATKFFNKAGILCCVTKEIPSNYVLERFFPFHFRTCVVLIYLELALRKCLGGPGAGTQGTPRLVKLAKKKGYVK